MRTLNVFELNCFSRNNNSKYLTVNFGTAVNRPYMTQKVQKIVSHENYKSPGVLHGIALWNWLTKCLSQSMFVQFVFLKPK